MEDFSLVGPDPSSNTGEFNDSIKDKVLEEHEVDKTLKYQYLIDEDQVNIPCPNGCKPYNGIAYRFVDSEEITDNQFRATILVDRERNAVRRVVKGDALCKQYAISLYESFDTANNAFNFLSARYVKNWSQRFIAEGYLEENDGLASEVDITGHFSYFEYRSAYIFDKFVVITQKR